MPNIANIADIYLINEAFCDGVVQPYDDAGNTIDDYGCSSNCKLESPLKVPEVFSGRQRLHFKKPPRKN